MRHIFSISFTNKLVYLVVFLLIGQCLHAQIPSNDTISAAVLPKDTVKAKKPVLTTLEDSTKKRARTAAIRSAMLPGLGQIYNKKYWKIPIVWGGLSVGIAISLYQLKIYKRHHQNYIDVVNSTSIVNGTESFKSNSQEYKQRLNRIKESAGMYYSYWFLFTAVFYALNILDAFVDAYLYEIDHDKSLSLNPILLSPSLIENRPIFGLSLNLKF